MTMNNQLRNYLKEAFTSILEEAKHIFTKLDNTSEDVQYYKDVNKTVDHAIDLLHQHGETLDNDPHSVIPIASIVKMISCIVMTPGLKITHRDEILFDGSATYGFKDIPNNDTPDSERIYYSLKPNEMVYVIIHLKDKGKQYFPLFKTNEKLTLAYLTKVSSGVKI